MEVQADHRRPEVSYEELKDALEQAQLVALEKTDPAAQADTDKGNTGSAGVDSG